MMRQPSRYYFFLPEPKVGCHPPIFWLGAAAIVDLLSFRLLRFPIAFLLAFGHADFSLGLMMTQWLNAEYRVNGAADRILIAPSVPSANASRLAASAFSKSGADNVSITPSNRIQQEPDLLERTLLAGRRSRPSRHPRS
jgi:hypothetical protein